MIIDISSPCYSGTIKALALKYPVHTLVIRNNIFQKLLTTAVIDVAEKEVTAVEECDMPIRKTVIFQSSSQIPIGR